MHSKVAVSCCKKMLITAIHRIQCFIVRRRAQKLLLLGENKKCWLHTTFHLKTCFADINPALCHLCAGSVFRWTVVGFPLWRQCMKFGAAEVCRDLSDGLRGPLWLIYRQLVDPSRPPQLCSVGSSMPTWREAKHRLSARTAHTAMTLTAEFKCARYPFK